MGYWSRVDTIDHINYHVHRGDCFAREKPSSPIKADRLLFLTKSGGVWDAEARLLPVVKLNDISGLIRAGIVRDGMIPKLRSCARILGRAVGEIDILSPAVPEGLLRAAQSQEAVGTRIVKG